MAAPTLADESVAVLIDWTYPMRLSERPQQNRKEEREGNALIWRRFRHSAEGSAKHCHRDVPGTRGRSRGCNCCCPARARGRAGTIEGCIHRRAGGFADIG